jgi:hypothetical protein
MENIAKTRILSRKARCLKNSEARGAYRGLEGKTGYETYSLETVAKTIGDANSFQVPPYNSNGLVGSKCDSDFKLVVDLNGTSLQSLELQIVKVIVIGKIAPDVRLQPTPIDAKSFRSSSFGLYAL